MANGYKAALSRFEAAVRAHEMRGAGPPEDEVAIQREYAQAKAALVTKLAYRSLRDNRPPLICNPTPLTDEEVEYHRSQGTIV